MKQPLLKIAGAAAALFLATQNAQAQTKGNSPIPDNSCLIAAGALNGPMNFPEIVDGATLKDTGDVKSLRSKAKDGRTIFIRGGNFAGQKFGNDNFSNICFIGTKLTNTRWSKSKANGIGFINSDLAGAAFDRVIMDYALFRNSILTNVDATGAQLAYGRFDGGWEPSMANLKLDNARMVGFVFSCGVTSADGCSFDRKQLSLRGADLTGASLASFSMWDARLDQAQLQNTILSIDQITQFSGANLKGNVLVRADKRQVSLTPDMFRSVASALSATR